MTNPILIVPFCPDCLKQSVVLLKFKLTLQHKAAKQVIVLLSQGDEEFVGTNYTFPIGTMATKSKIKPMKSRNNQMTMGDKYHSSEQDDKINILICTIQVKTICSIQVVRKPAGQKLTK